VISSADAAFWRYSRTTAAGLASLHPKPGHKRLG
jgi:hypothetical protein